MLAFVGVNVAGDVMTRFTKQVLGIPAVIECHRVTGEHSFLLKVLVSSAEELEQVIDMLTPYTHTTTYLVSSTAFSTRTLDPKQAAKMKGTGKAKQSRAVRGP